MQVFAYQPTTTACLALTQITKSMHNLTSLRDVANGLLEPSNPDVLVLDGAQNMWALMGSELYEAQARLSNARDWARSVDRTSAATRELQSSLNSVLTMQQRIIDASQAKTATAARGWLEMARTAGDSTLAHARHAYIEIASRIRRAAP